MSLFQRVSRTVPPLALLVPGLLAAAPLSAQEPARPSVEERLTAVEKKLDKAEGEGSMQVHWKDGLRIESADKRYKFKLGGRLQYDGAFLDPDADTRSAVGSSIEDGTEFRRARIEMSGEVPERIEWSAGFDFAADKVSFRTLYVGLKDLPFGNLRLGQQKEPFGLEQITSSKDITFLERSLTSAAEPAYNAGILLFDTMADERMTWAVGAFRTAADNGEVSKGDGEWAETARLTGLPYMSEDGRSYVHLGLSASHRSAPGNTATFAAKPESNIAPTYLDISTPADSVMAWRPEFAWTQGPCSLQAEYTLAQADAPSGSSDRDVSGWYTQFSWFVTGEHRPYKKASGAIGPVKPKENAFGPDGGSGAWELAARYSTLDFTETDDGELDDVTFGVNWYPNPNTRVMLNYVLAQLDPPANGPSGDTKILEFRVQFAF